MDRCALFVDAGYALADGAMAVHGTRRRDSVSWDHAGLLKLLAGLARDRTGLPVLRCYWYETAAEGRRTAEHDALAEMPGLKLRLVNALPGRREGIESQLRRDLVTLAKSGAITDAFIASANEHIAEIVAEVQDLGLRVVILHIASDGGWTIPLPLRQECDDIVEISGVHLRSFVDLIKGAEAVSTEDQYPAGGYGARGAEARNTVVGALTHQGFPAAALPAPGAVYQVTDSRDSRPAGSGYGSQPAPQAVGYHQDGSVLGQSGQPQYLGAPTGGGTPAGLVRESGVLGPHAAVNAQAPAAPSQYPVSSGYDAASGSGYQNGAAGAYPGSTGMLGAGQAGVSPMGFGQQAGGQPGLNQTGPILADNGSNGSRPNPTGPIAIRPDSSHAQNGGSQNGGGQNGFGQNGGVQNGSPQNGYAGERPLTVIPATGFPTTNYDREPGHNGSGPNGFDQAGSGAPLAGQLGYPAAPQNGQPHNGAGQNGSSQNGVGQNGVGQFRYQPGQPTAPGAAQAGHPPFGTDQAVGQQVSAGPQPGQAPGGGQAQPYQYPPAQSGQAQSGPGLQPGQYQSGQYQSGQQQSGQQQPGQQPGQYQSGQYQPGQQPGQYQPGQYQPGQYQPGQYQPGQQQPPASPGYSVGQNGSAQAGMPRSPQAQQGGYQPGQMTPPDQRQRDPYGGGPQGAPVAGAPDIGSGQPAGGFGPGQAGPNLADQAQRGSFGQHQAQGAGALMQPQLAGQQTLAPPQQAGRVQQSVAIALPDAVKAAHSEGYTFGESIGRDAPGLWLEAVLARKPRMPSDLEARLLQGSVLPIDSLLHDEVRHSLRRGFWDALESARR